MRLFILLIFLEDGHTLLDFRYLMTGWTRLFEIYPLKPCLSCSLRHDIGICKSCLAKLCHKIYLYVLASIISSIGWTHVQKDCTRVRVGKAFASTHRRQHVEKGIRAHCLPDIFIWRSMFCIGRGKLQALQGEEGRLWKGSCSPHRCPWWPYNSLPRPRYQGMTLCLISRGTSFYWKSFPYNRRHHRGECFNLLYLQVLGTL